MDPYPETLETDLDISWIEEHEKEMNIDSVILKEPMNQLEIIFVYINKNDFIEHLEKEQQLLKETEDNKHIITKERILYLIQKRKYLSGSFLSGSNSDTGIKKKYKLIDLLFYHVGLEPENIQYFSKEENISHYSKDFFKSLPFFNDVVVPDSLYIFNSIHRLYFIFKEVDKEETKKVLKPILKKCNKTKVGNIENKRHDKTKKIMDDFKEGEPHNVTKKVGFVDLDVEENINKNHSKTHKKKIV